MKGADELREISNKSRDILNLERIRVAMQKADDAATRAAADGLFHAEITVENNICALVSQRLISSGFTVLRQLNSASGISVIEFGWARPR